jgi:hypothetical protein
MQLNTPYPCSPYLVPYLEVFNPHIEMLNLEIETLHCSNIAHGSRKAKEKKTKQKENEYTYKIAQKDRKDL